LVEPGERRPEDGTTYGVGQLIAAAVDAGAKRIILGLGGSGTNDAGAGLLAALGATAVDGDLAAGAAGLAELTAVDLEPALSRVAGIEFVAASDVENPMLGLRGATNIFGSQKGITDDRKPAVDGYLTKFAELTRRARARRVGSATRCCCSGPSGCPGSTWWRS
jgi:glycerate kinase